MNESDYIGKTFNRITIIGKDEERTTKDCFYVTGKCTCGRIKSYARHRLMGKDAPQSCGCIQRELKAGKKYLPPGEAAIRETWRIYKENAKRRKFSFSIDLLNFKSLTQKPCHYCGAPPTNVHKTRTKTPDSCSYSGLDRVKTREGYSVENVVTCCAVCNWMKGTMEYAEFIKQVEKISNHLKSLDRK